MEIKQALADLRKDEKRKFEQSVDLLISLKGVDPKKDNITAVIEIPNKIKEKKVCGFLTKRSEVVKSITPLDFPKYKDKKALKALVKEFDFFISVPSLMPSVATHFGKVLGPAGKMPSPQMGVLGVEDEKAIKALVEKISNSMKIRVKEASIKVSIGKETMADDKLIENIQAVYNGIINVLPVKKDNVKKMMLKLTMSKPIQVEIK